jgi:hypothetical protein
VDVDNNEADAATHHLQLNKNDNPNINLQLFANVSPPRHDHHVGRAGNVVGAWVGLIEKPVPEECSTITPKWKPPSHLLRGALRWYIETKI